MSFRNQQIYTSVLTNATFTFTADMSIQTISLNLASGVGQFNGSLSIGALLSSPISLNVNQPVVISSDSGYPLDGITIDCVAGGVINIMARQ
jgi:hypothetical protein